MAMSCFFSSEHGIQSTLTSWVRCLLHPVKASSRTSLYVRSATVAPFCKAFSDLKPLLEEPIHILVDSEEPVLTNNCLEACFSIS